VLILIAADDAGALLPDPAVHRVPVPRLNNTLTALVITHLVITVPIVVYIMAGYFETLPKELEEAALIDGGSVWTTFPLCRAAARAAGASSSARSSSFIFSWNNFVFGAVPRRPRDAHAARRRLQRAHVRAARMGTAGGRRASSSPLPVLLLTIVIQKEIVAAHARRRQGVATSADRQRAQMHSSAASSPTCCTRMAVDGARRRDRPSSTRELSAASPRPR
jgi:hypothetical protein